jgi:hypothetical protein
MAFALIILSFGTLFSGYFLKDAFVGIGTTFWGNSIYKLDLYNVGLDFEFIPLGIKNIPLFFSLSGIFVGITLNNIFNFYKNFTSIKSYKKVTVNYPQYFTGIV